MTKGSGGPCVRAKPRGPQFRQNAGWALFGGQDMRRRIAAMGHTQRAWSRMVGLSERGTTKWLTSDRIPGTIATLLAHTELLAEIEALLARTGPGQLVRKGDLQRLLAAFRLAPAPKPPPKVQKPRKPRKKPVVAKVKIKLPGRKGRGFGAPRIMPVVEDDGRRLDRILNSIPKVVRPVKPPPDGIY